MKKILTKLFRGDFNKNAKRSPWKKAPLAMEAMEERSLLSGNPIPTGISLNGYGTLIINGDDSDDAAVVTLAGNKVKVTLDQRTMVKLDLNTYVPLTIHSEKQFDKSLVKKIEFFGNGGNDYFTNNTAISCTAVGGDGADTLTGGMGDDLLDGKDGDDTLEGRGGDDLLKGEAGDDTYVFAGAHLGSDTVTEAGNADNDTLDFSGINMGKNRSGKLTINPGINIDLASTTLQTVHANATTVNLQLTLSDPDGIETVWGTNSADVIKGNARDNWLYGMGGNDSIWDRAGNDYVFGGDGSDRLYGGVGLDHLDGGAQDDVLVSIGGGQNDVLTGGMGYDSYWLDKEASEQITDASPAENAGSHVHRVGGFYANHDVVVIFPLTETPSRELLGQDLMDPLSKTPGYAKDNFSAKPLFASGGPTKNDIDQNAAADCYFMSTLAAIAKVAPDHVRQMVTDLGDGTYAVRFYDGMGNAEYVRVDGDLYVQGGKPIYAGLGREGSTWVAIVEKAWCFYRENLGTYTSIEYWEPPDVLHSVYNSLGVTDQQIIIANVTENSMVQSLADALAQGKGIVISGPGNLAPGLKKVYDDPSTPQNEANQHSAQHAYLLDSMSADKKFITIRNPYATQGPAMDGYLTISIDELYYFGYDIRIITVP